MAMGNILRGDSLSAPWRILLTIILAGTFIYVFILTVIAAFGKPPFNYSTGEVSSIFFICITPAVYNFYIWYIIYLGILCIVVYAIILLFAKIEDTKACVLGGPVSLLFIVFLIITLNLCISWVFAWDFKNTLASAIILLFVVLSANVALVLALYSFWKDGAKIYQKSLFHFWSGIIVINAVGLYYGYTVIALLINAAIYFHYDVGLGSNGLCVGMLIFALILVIVWFIIENTILIRFLNPLLLHYFALFWIVTAITVEQNGLTSSEVWALILTLLVVSILAFLCRIILLIFRNWKNAIYGKPCEENCS